MGHVKFPALFTAGVEQVAELGQSKSDRPVRLDRDPHNLSVIPVDPGRDVQAQYRFAGTVHQVDDLPVMSPNIL